MRTTKGRASPFRLSPETQFFPITNPQNGKEDVETSAE
jgi:hypothetical protein